MIIACNRGKHRVGLLSALIRRLQGWSLTMTFDEYKRFFASTNAAGEGKDAGGRVGDYEVSYLRLEMLEEKNNPIN